MCHVRVWKIMIFSGCLSNCMEDGKLEEKISSITNPLKARHRIDNGTWLGYLRRIWQDFFQTHRMPHRGKQNQKLPDCLSLLWGIPDQGHCWAMLKLYWWIMNDIIFITTHSHPTSCHATCELGHSNVGKFVLGIITVRHLLWRFCCMHTSDHRRKERGFGIPPQGIPCSSKTPRLPF